MNNTNKKQKRQLTLRSNVKTLAIKIYDEQLPDGWEVTIKAIENTSKKEYQIIAIKHDKDDRGDDFFAPSIEKAHYHILVRVADDKPRHVSTILNLLHVKFRKGADDVLLREHALETVNNFATYTTYLTHETDVAQAEGKYPYAREELVSNLTSAEIEEIREGYIRLTDGKRKINEEEMANLDAQAKKLGEELKDFDEWFFAQPFSVRRKSDAKTLREMYDYAAKEKIEEMQKYESGLIRTCIFIQGAPNSGKTYAAIHSLPCHSILKINGGKTGKFDYLKNTTEAIILDDYSTSSILNLSDNYPCAVYVRNRGNKYFCGNYLIVTSNLTFEEWALEKCRLAVENLEALKSRFYICRLENANGHKRLNCLSPSRRGNEMEQKIRKNNYLNFRNLYNEIINQYQPSKINIDYSDINDDEEEWLSNNLDFFLEPEIELTEEEIEASRQYLANTKAQ